MERADELIEAMAKAIKARASMPPMAETPELDNPEECAQAALSAIESAGYIVGKMRWHDNHLFVGRQRVLVVDDAYERTDAEAAVRKAVVGE